MTAWIVRNRAWGPFLLAVGLSLAVFGEAAALGLGPLRTQSALNQPFYAEIDLLDVDPDGLDAVKARLAGADEFDKAGAERPHFLTGLRFTPMLGPAGRPVVQVTSREPVREPFLNFLVEVVWPDGRLVKEYTVLLDPPVVTAGRAPPVSLPQTAPTTRYPSPQPGPARHSAQSPVPSPQPPQVRDASAAREPPRSGQRDALPARASRTTPVPTPPVVPEEARATEFPLRYGPVRAGDGLWRIARRMTPPGATIAQTAMAAYRNSPGAFADGDINLLRLGSELLIPTVEELFALDAAAADRQFRDAMAGRDVSTRPLTDVPEAAELRIVTAPVGDGKEPSPGTAERIADSEPDTIGELEEDLLLVREASESNRQEATELRERIQDLEQQLSDIRRLLELRNEQLAQLQTVIRESEAARALGLDSAEARGVPASSAAVDGATGGSTPQASPEPAKPETSTGRTAAVVDGPTAEANGSVLSAADTPQPRELTDDAMSRVALGAAAILPLLGTLIWLVLARRRRQAESEGPDQVTTRRGSASATSGRPAGLPAPDTGRKEDRPVSGAGAPPPPEGSSAGDRARLPEASLESARDHRQSGERRGALPDDGARHGTRRALPGPDASLDAPRDAAQPDPLAEADIYILYGRYREAERILSDQLRRSPGRVDLRYKLAETLLGSGNREALASLLGQMTAAGEDQADPARFAAIERRCAEADGSAVPGAAAADGRHAAAPVGAATPEVPEPPGEVGDITLDLAGAERRGGFEERGAAEESVLGFSVEEISPESADSLRIHFKELEEGLFDLDDDAGGAGRRGGEAMSPIPSEEGRRVSYEPDQGARASRASAWSDDRSGGDPLAEPWGWSSERSVAGTVSAGDDELDLDLSALDRLEDADERASAPDHPADAENDGEPPVDPFAEAELGRVYEQATASIDALGAGPEASGGGGEPPGDEGLSDDVLSSQWRTEPVAWDEIDAKMDLARAYIDMDDPDAARAILGEVVDDGNEEQQAAAKALLAGLG